MNYEQYFSNNARHMKRSEIRELLKLIAKPGIISFAGGLPAPDLFPINEIKEICKMVMEREGKSALQYGPTEGDIRLREELSKFMRKDGVQVKPENITIITSSQQGLDLIAKVFCDPGDIVMTGKPTYVGGIQAFHSYGADMHGIRLDEDGTNTQILEQELAKLRNLGKRPKFIYEIPDFQNPSGITMSLKRRQELVDLAEKYDLLIIEDSPYRQLRFEGQTEPTIYSLCPERTIGLYTFSKILLPGFRLGWVIGPAEITAKLVTAKQAVDLCSPPFNQAILYAFMNSGQLEKQIERIIVAYREKRDFMLAKLEAYMPKLSGLKWTRPSGGLFLWVTLPENMDATEMFISAIDKKVAYVVGTAFHPDSSGQNTFRLNFSYSSMNEIDEGIKRLAEVVAEWTENKGNDTFITP